jgi:hypothetical protein
MKPGLVTFKQTLVFDKIIRNRNKGEQINKYGRFFFVVYVP